MEKAELDLKGLGAKFEEEAKGVHSEEDLLRLKSAYLGKKGHLSLFLRSLGDLPVESRPLYGAQANELKQRIEEECHQLLDSFSLQKRERKLQEEAVDITLPGRSVASGRLHPLTQILEEVEDIFRDIGFSVFEGPEIETDYYNFEALNIHRDHPARDMQDTFYVGRDTALSPHPSSDSRGFTAHSHSAYLLRTHTSPVQIHVMEKTKPPIRMIAPGVVYRRDSDISHTPMFHQVEGLVVDEGVKFSDLKGVVSYFFHRLFGASLKLRFRPSYFPFTEPSAEVDIQCVICGAMHRTVHGKKNCRLCKSTGWLEVMGCGMVNPAVFRSVRYDTKKYSGFAFGMGIERLTMLKYGIPDIRLFFENDLRFLKQF